jgi:hypothetical protein
MHSYSQVIHKGREVGAARGVEGKKEVKWDKEKAVLQAGNICGAQADWC